MLVHDSHSAHTSMKFLNVLFENNLASERIPIGCSELSAVEKVWSHMKFKWRTAMTNLDDGELEEEEVRAILQSIIDEAEADEDLARRLCKTVYETFANLLST